MNKKLKLIIKEELKKILNENLKSVKQIMSNTTVELILYLNGDEQNIKNVFNNIDNSSAANAAFVVKYTTSLDKLTDVDELIKRAGATLNLCYFTKIGNLV